MVSMRGLSDRPKLRQPAGRSVSMQPAVTSKKFRKEGARPLAIHWGFIGPCFAGGAWLDMYTLSLLGDRGEEVHSEILADLLDNCPILFDKVG
jgi:hypothetical protein